MPKGTSVAVSIYAMQRDPALWPHPEEFIPERWLESEAAAAGLTPVNDAWMVFGNGTLRVLGSCRICR